MNTKLFIDEHNLFSMEIPSEWEQNDDGNTETYTFFNPNEWKGNFRITQFSPGYESATRDANVFIDEWIDDNIGFKFKKIAHLHCAFFKDFSADEDCVFYSWVIGEGQIVLTCSFTIEKQMEHTKSNVEELLKIYYALETFKVI